MKGIILGVAALTLVVIGALAGRSFLERQAARRDFEALREELWSARSQADSCRVALIGKEQEFRRFDAFVDSLHARVRAFEDAAQGGVPGSEYSDYLTTFDRYNDSVAVWQDRADSLQAVEESCRALAGVHNTLQDSVRRRFPVSGEGDP